MVSLFYSIVFAFVYKLRALNYYVTLGLLFIFLAVGIYKYWKLARKYSGFPSFPLLAFNAYAFVFRKFPKNTPFTCFVFQKFVSVMKKYQNEGLCVMWIGQPHLFIFGEEAFKVFSNEPAAVDKMDKYDILSEVLGTGLVTRNGETWTKHRKLLTPVFHVGVLKQMIPIFNRYGKILVEKISKVENDPSVDILEYLKSSSLNSLFESIFGLKMNTPENDEQLKQFVNCVDEFVESVVYRMCNPWLRYKFFWNMTPYAKRFNQIIKESDDFFQKVISNMKEHVLASKSNGTDLEHDKGTPTKSFAHILMDISMKDPSFTMEDFKSHVVTFIGAGYDTTAYTLQYCLFMLGLHPDVQEQVYTEVNSLPDSFITFANLHDLRYLKCVIKETMRIYTTVPVYGRRTNKDIQCGKYLVPKGTDVVFCPYMLHRDPKIYPNPEEFQPERFLEQNSEKRPWTYTPFSEGLRNCIGKRFAMMEMMVLLAHTIRNFKITSLDKRKDLDLCLNLVLTPTKPLRIIFTSRK